MISSKSPQDEQRWFWVGVRPVEAQPMQRNSHTARLDFDAEMAGSVIRMKVVGNGDCNVMLRITDGQAGLSRQLFSSQIPVGLVDPVRPRWVKYIEINGLKQSFGTVRHIGRYGKHFSGFHYDFFAIDPELKRAFK